MFDFGFLVWNFLYLSIVSSFRITKISTALYSSDCHLYDSLQTVVGTSFHQAQQWKKIGWVLLLSIVRRFLLTHFLSIWVLYSCRAYNTAPMHKRTP